MEIRIGKPDIDTQSLGHTPGVRQGNSRGNYESMSGHLPDGNPIDPRMPNIPPG